VLRQSRAEPGGEKLQEKKADPVKIGPLEEEYDVVSRKK